MTAPVTGDPETLPGAACDTRLMRSRSRRIRVAVAAVLTGAAVLTVTAVAVMSPGRPDVAPTGTGTVAAPGDTLVGVTIAPETPIAGFDRDALFGAKWQVVGGCTTRDRVLSAQLEGVVHVAGSPCKVLSGVLHDPYTGATIQFRADRPTTVQIDHRVPLREACQSGACGPGWTTARRRAFANDARNLVATTAHANESKGDQDPAGWMPLDPVQRCRYAAGYVATKRVWGLSVDQAEAAALSRVLDSCA